MVIIYVIKNIIILLLWRAVGWTRQEVPTDDERLQGAARLSQARLWWSLFAICEGINTLNKHVDPAHCIFGTLRHVWKCLKSIEINWNRMESSYYVTWMLLWPSNDEPLRFLLACSNLIMPWPSHQSSTIFPEIPGVSLNPGPTPIYRRPWWVPRIAKAWDFVDLCRTQPLDQPLKMGNVWKCGLGIPNEPSEMNAHLSHLSQQCHSNAWLRQTHLKYHQMHSTCGFDASVPESSV